VIAAAGRPEKRLSESTNASLPRAAPPAALPPYQALFDRPVTVGAPGVRRGSGGKGDLPNGGGGCQPECPPAPPAPVVTSGPVTSSPSIRRWPPHEPDATARSENSFS
jgi:hypothetical protein